MQQLSVADGSSQVLMQAVRLLRAEGTVQQLVLALQQPEALLQLDAVLQQLLKQKEKNIFPQCKQWSKLLSTAGVIT